MAKFGDWSFVEKYCHNCGELAQKFKARPLKFYHNDIIRIIKRRMNKFLEHFEDSKHCYDSIISELLPRMAKLR